MFPIKKLEPPHWWYEGPTPALAWSLYPLSAAYGAIAVRRFKAAVPYRSKLPVICVGNFTMGGAGKTPLALMLAHLLRDSGHNPGFLSRGYGGREAGPHRVDAHVDDAIRVGDEPLLLARCATTVVSRVRPAGAQLLESLGVSVIIMDDGFQNPSLHKDFGLLAVDAGTCIGNGKVFPLGPLRAPFKFQARMANAVVILGSDRDDALSKLKTMLEESPSPPGLFEGEIVPAINEQVTAGEVLAFCGIGRPAKFFETLRRAAIGVSATRSFPDHHSYTDADAKSLLAEARAKGLSLMTTEKDMVRLKARPGPLEELRRASIALPVSLSLVNDDQSRLMQALSHCLSR